MRHLSFAASWLLATSLCGDLIAQFEPENGFQTSVLSAAPAGAFVGGLCGLPNGNLAVFDGTSVVELDATSGATLRTLFTPGGFVFGSFLAVDPGGTYLLFGESTNQDIWKVPLSGAPATVVANMMYNFDGEFIAPDIALITRGEPSFTYTYIYHLDVTSGATDMIAEVLGPSGPLTADQQGNIYYGLNSAAWPPPPGSGEIIRWTAAQIGAALGPTYLQQSDSLTFATGLGAITDILFDNQGDLLVSDSSFGTLWEFRADGQPRDLVGMEQSTSSVTYLAILDAGAPGQAVFGPFQPESGGTVAAFSSDWVSYNDINLIRPLRPAFETSPGMPLPVGPYSVSLFDGPESGTMFVLASAGVINPENRLLNGGVPFFLGLDQATMLPLGIVNLSSDGSFTVAGNNPGLSLTAYVQGALFDGNGHPLGTTEVLDLQLQ
ncbi:MAG: hypothetical protein V2A76_07060 [Planctomycetota bacterium]